MRQVADEHPRPNTGTDAQPSAVGSSRGAPSHDRATGASVPKARTQAVAATDASKNGQGCWCNMQVCGARHKMRRYRERKSGSR